MAMSHTRRANGSSATRQPIAKAGQFGSNGSSPFRRKSRPEARRPPHAPVVISRMDAKNTQRAQHPHPRWDETAWRSRSGRAGRNLLKLARKRQVVRKARQNPGKGLKKRQTGHRAKDGQCARKGANMSRVRALPDRRARQARGARAAENRTGAADQDALAANRDVSCASSAAG